jgi:hypothetical protein
MLCNTASQNIRQRGRGIWHSGHGEELEDLLDGLRGSPNEHVDDITIERAALSTGIWQSYPSFPTKRAKFHEPSGYLMVERLPCKYMPVTVNEMHFYFNAFCLRPGKQRATNIASMEILNPLRWRSDRDLHNVRWMSSDAHRLAAFIQSRGTILSSEKTCTRCLEGFGPWVDCVSVDDGGSAACDNCTYTGKEDDCQYPVCRS